MQTTWTDQAVRMHIPGNLPKSLLFSHAISELHIRLVFEDKFEIICLISHENLCFDIRSITAPDKKGVP